MSIRDKIFARILSVKESFDNIQRIRVIPFYLKSDEKVLVRWLWRIQLKVVFEP